MSHPFKCYGCIKVDLIANYMAREIVRSVVDNSSFSLDENGNIIIRDGNYLPKYTELKELVETLYDEVEKEGFDKSYDTKNKFSMYGKLFIDFTDYEDACDVMVLAVSDRRVTVFPDNS